MVLKHFESIFSISSSFENDVEMYGAQAIEVRITAHFRFENDVEMYGAQAKKVCNAVKSMFENDVEMYGAQAEQSEKMLF